MKNQVNSLKKLEIIDNSVVSVDTTTILANTKFNKPKCFNKNKFNKENHPKPDKDCKLKFHTANNEDKDKNYTFYFGYKNLKMCDAKSGLPIFEVALTGEKADVTILNNFLDEINVCFSLKDANILADKGFDSKNNYNHIKDELNAYAFIAKNKRNSKTNEKLSCGNPLCEARLAMHKYGKQYLKHSIKQKYCCSFITSTDDSSYPSNHPKYNNGHKNKGCVKYESVGIDYRSSIDETSDYFKQYYSLRIES